MSEDAELERLVRKAQREEQKKHDQWCADNWRTLETYLRESGIPEAAITPERIAGALRVAMARRLPTLDGQPERYDARPDAAQADDEHVMELPY